METKILPLIIDKNELGDTSLVQYLTDNKEGIKSQLLGTGGILFKNFGIDDAVKLESVVNVFKGNSLNYASGNSPRTRLHNNVYTSTEHPADEFISLHNELSYSNVWPSYLFFCCEIVPNQGGNTIIADSRSILKDLSGELVEAFDSKGVQYIRNLHGGYGAGSSWQKTFETDSKENVEQYCKENDIQFEWGEDDALRIIQKRKAMITHPETREKVWFNQADQFHPSTNTREVFEAMMEIYEDDPRSMPQYATFGDGDEIPLYMLEEVRKVSEKNTVYFDWEKGDLLLLDNILVSHGRSPFQGSRKILVSMSA